MRRWVIGLAVTLAVMIGAFCAALWTSQRGGARALSAYLEQLRAQGEKLKYSELAVPPSTDPVEVASRTTFANNPLSDPGRQCVLMWYVTNGKARVAWQGTLYLAATNYGKRGDVLDDWGVITEQNHKTKSTVDLLKSALEHPAPDSGFIYKDSGTNLVSYTSPGLRTAAHLGRALANLAVEDLHEANLDAALTNILMLAKLANLSRNDLEFLNVSVRRSNAHLGVMAVWEALQAPGWDDDRLAELQKAWSDVDLMTGLERALEAGRIHYMVTIELIRETKFTKMFDLIESDNVGPDGNLIRPNILFRWFMTIEGGIYKFHGLDEDEIAGLQDWGSLIEAVRAVKSDEPLPDLVRHTHIRGWQADTRLEGMTAYRKAIDNGMWTTYFLSDSVRQIIEVEAERRMAIVAIAIKRYQIKHGAPPASLKALVPEFLDAVPIDPMSGKPLCYRLKDDGAFVLYSVGEDGKDDGGDPSPTQAGEKPGLWEGRDAVWPAAATAEEEATWSREQQQVKQAEADDK